DLIGDACDNCPEVPNHDQSDVQETAAAQPADGIGDVCDPNPSLPGDMRILFEPFNDQARLSQWHFPIGLWTEGGGALHQSDANAGSALAYFDRLTGPTWIDVQAKVESIGGIAGGAVSAGAWFATTAPTGGVLDGYLPDGYLCGFTAATATT